MIRVEVDKENKIGKILIDRPEKMNIITIAMRREIGEKLLELDNYQQLKEYGNL